MRSLPATLAFLALLTVPQAFAQGEVPNKPQTETPNPAQKSLQGASMRPLDITLNGAPVGQWTLLESSEGLFATPEMLKEWRLVTPPSLTPVRYRGQQWIPLYALPGYRAKIDFASQSLALEMSASAFEVTQLGIRENAAPALSPKATALYLNYDVSHNRSYAAAGGVLYETGALGELGLSYGPGMLMTSFIGRSLFASDPLLRPEWRRLESTWTLDLPEKNRTLRIGDASTRSSLWGRSQYYGGFQIGSNFGLTPGFIAQPIPTLAGTATGPSTIELYVNDVLRQTNQVQAGPFTVDNFNQLSGAGEIRVVVRDVLGRESVVTRSFFTNANLLAPNVADWSFDAGRLRYNLGTVNADYRSAFASGLYRRGVSEGLTVETRVDYSRAVRSGGAGITVALPFQFLGQFAAVGSRTESLGSGNKLLLGADQQLLRSGMGYRMTRSTRTYRELGAGIADEPYRTEQAFNVRYSTQNDQAFGLAAARIASHDGTVVRTSTLTWSLRLFERASISLGLNRVQGAATATTLNASLVIPLENRSALTSTATSSASGLDWHAGFSSPLDGQTGTGYRALGGSRSGGAYAEGGVYHQGDRIYVAADASANKFAQTLRLNAQGALVLAEGSVYAARRLNESFGIIEVKGYPDVGVGLQGNSLTRTDRNGIAILPRLLPYQVNNVRLNPNDLPVSAEIDNIELQAVPAWRSAVKVSFPVRSGRAALLRIVMEDGEQAPAGATLRIDGDDKEFFVARRGEAYVTGLARRNTLRMAYKDRSCAFEVVLPPGSPDEIPRIGPLSCIGRPQ